MAPRIEDYGLIGDLQTAALVSREASIDWCCFPRFDSGACFAALLGDERHGCWSLRPSGTRPWRVDRRYREDTLVLETEFESDAGAVRVIDFMPPRETKPDIVRIVEGLSGKVELHSELVIRFDYGAIVPWVHRVDDARVATAGPDALCIRTPVELRGEDMRTRADFTVSAGERVPFVVTWFPSHESLPTPVDPEQALRDTETYWREWADRCHHPEEGDYHDQIHRSLLVLKALTYAPTGGIVAAPTTSLPEKLGGVRNWDYRYCWLRDASITLLALLQAGYVDEAREWRNWLLRAVAGDAAEIQIMYGVAGERRLSEYELDHLPGYEESRPVRIGNKASEQTQLDVYGEVIDSLYQARVHGLQASEEFWSLEQLLLDFLETGWKEPDAGVWEVRGPERHFTHSKVMAWVAFDRAVKAVEHYSMEGPVERWRETRDRIRDEILRKAWNEEKGAFTQFYGSDRLDAAVLVMPLVGFLPADDGRMVGTVEAIQRELMIDGLVARYPADDENEGIDGLPPGEGVFLPCTFWLADNLAQQGRRDEARETFERLLGLQNDLGLFAEEYDPSAGRLLGNFPQAWSHVALINTAYNISHGEDMWRRRQGRHHETRA